MTCTLYHQSCCYKNFDGGEVFLFFFFEFQLKIEWNSEKRSISLISIYEWNYSREEKVARKRRVVGHGWMNAIHACSILSPSPGSFSFTGSPKDSPPIKKKKEKKKRKEKARDGRKLSMHIYHMNERVLVPTLPCILLLSTDYLSIVPRVLKPRKNKKGTKIRTKQFP